jgi:hypothetical protein
VTARHGRPVRAGAPRRAAAKHGRTRSRRWAGAAVGLAVTALVVGAVAEAATGTLPPGITPAHAPVAGRGAAGPSAVLQAQFKAAATEFHVPLGVLMAVSYQETLWESHQGEPSATGNYNVMGLTSVSTADLVPTTAARKTADLAAASVDSAANGAGNSAANGTDHGTDGTAAGGTAPSARVLSQFETVDTSDPALHTLDAAAALIEQPDSALRGTTRQSVRGGAALLASYQQQSTGTLPTDPARWYGAVAEYSQGSDAATEAQFADRVYATIATGATRTTDDGQVVALAAEPSVRPQVPSALRAPGGAGGGGTGGDGTVARSLAVAPVPAAPCEPAVGTGLRSCALVPAAKGNTETANRPGDGDAVRYIVLGGTGGSAASAVSTAADPASGVSAHVVVAATGAVTQLVPTRDVSTQTGNATVDAHAVEIQTEGFPLLSGSWITEQEYASTAAVVRDLAGAYGIPLDRDHILGQDDVPYPTAAAVAASAATAAHAVPGPYWDWGHFLDLLGVAPDGDGLPVVGGTVTVAPAYSAADKPVLTGCSADACVAHPVDFVYLRTAPSSSAPLLDDRLLKSSGLSTASTDSGDDSDKAVYGQTFVVAALSAHGDWTAIWFGGGEAWFYNPGGVNSYANTDPAQDLVSPRNGTAIPVYGLAVPGTGGQLLPLPYSIKPGQAYTASDQLTGDAYAYDGHGCTTHGCTVVIGTTGYEAIRYNHRIAYVLASDVQTTKPHVPPSGRPVSVPATRIMDTRDGTGGVPVAPVPAGGTVALQLTGLPPSGVTAVTLNVTVLAPAADGSFTVYPDGQRRPSVPTVAYSAGVTATTPVTVPVVDGRVDFANASSSVGPTGGVDLAVDLTGYVTMSGGSGPFHTTAPVRLLDTVAGTATGTVRTAAASPTLQVAGSNGVPRHATAVVLNVTAARASAYGFVTVHPYGSAVPAIPPAASTLSFAGGELVTLEVTVPLVDGKVQFRASTWVALSADLVGYYTG